MDSFIRVAEVWQPSADGTVLELADGLFEAAPRFGAASRGMCFGRGEGLPGRAWELGRPLLLPRLEGSYFRRAAAARAAGLDGAAAIPVFRDGRLTCVVVLLCATGASGAIELWHNDPRVTGDLRLEEAIAGAGAAALEALGRDAYLPRGAGLPGEAWRREAAVFVDGLDDTRRFLRGSEAAQAGIVHGLALPCGGPASEVRVLALLSSARTPVARRIESWRVGAPGTLQRAFGQCMSAGRLPVGPETALAEAALGLIGPARATATAAVGRGPGRLGAAQDDALAHAGLHTVLALPIVVDDSVDEVLALHF